MTKITFPLDHSHSTSRQLSAIWHINLKGKVAMTNTKSESDWSDLAEALKSAAHPERLSILHLMCNCSCDQMMVKTIYEALHLEQSITSRHLGIMKRGGLLRREIIHGKILYAINKDSGIAQSIKKLLTERK